MTATTFLSQLWGPILLAIGLGIFVSRKQYIHLYRELEKESLAVMTFGIGAVIIGILQVVGHNLWGSLNEVVITLLGWGTLIKGFVFLVFPKFVDRGGDWEVKSNLIPAVGVLLLILGAYLSIVGYYLV